MPDVTRAFGGLNRLYGAETLAILQTSHVCVIGIGGVGSWAAEALARCGVGTLTLIDLDHIAESNLNRQIHALTHTLGQAKVTAMRERIALINPDCHVQEVDEFIAAENVATLIGALPSHAVVVDACDDGRAKTVLLAYCKRNGYRIITCGAAGGRRDPTRLRVDDLARTQGDPIAAKLRANLRRLHGFSRDPKKKFGIPCVYSDEPIVQPKTQQACDINSTAQGVDAAPQGLSCAGYGSSVMVTASMGMVLAQQALAQLLSKAAS
ncbi:tRNA threonylcarbamoyladenosine dehydratase [Parvibium lacunae]|uniref:tRNA threonylcarbamoyladenosine dehydratase n=1 Tax=Parvibium lacunae TaxID=1888893 RepID=A0A368L0N0_9BURK|nr:tRNA threonylcarbamoyladenosine dehydratase [Parvibium lacunae]RCS57121.1 tRNA threonylcarbamoyladenosine dehydratase [Parvibium lacunae]